MTYPVVSLSVGRAAHQEFSTSDSGRMPDVRSDTRGPRHDGDSALENGLQELKEASAAAAQRLLKKSVRKADQDRLEAEFAIEKLYVIARRFPAQALRDPDFWRYVTFKVIDDWVVAQGATNAQYLGVVPSAMQDCTPLMMFNRSELSLKHALVLRCEPSQLYNLGADFWRSHILRVGTKYEDAVLSSVLRLALDGRLPTKIVRPFAKDIKARRSTIFLGCLTEAQADKLVEQSLVYAESVAEAES